MLPYFYRWSYRRYWKVSGSRAAPLYTRFTLFYSSNTWVGAGKKYVKTSTSEDTNEPVVSGPEICHALFVLNIGPGNSPSHTAQVPSPASTLLALQSDLNWVSKYRHWVHRRSYYFFSARHPQAIDRCCFRGKLPILLVQIILFSSQP